jgi:hypothetical protein
MSDLKVINSEDGKPFAIELSDYPKLTKKGSFETNDILKEGKFYLTRYLEGKDEEDREFKEVIFSINSKGGMVPISMRRAPEFNAERERQYPTGEFTTTFPKGFHRLENQFKKRKVSIIELFELTDSSDELSEALAKQLKKRKYSRKGGKKSYKNKSKKTQNKSKKRFFSMTY